MHLTSADARAAREGFHFVVMRGGTRVAYTTTAAEAKRECGKGCKVYPLARMRYTAQNPKAKGLSARDRFEAKRAQESEKWLREFSRDPVQVEAGSIRKRITERAGLGAHKAGCNWTGCVKGCPNANRWLEVHRQRELVELDRLKGKISAAKTATERKFWNAVLKEVSLARNPATKRAMLASLNRRIAAAERAGMPVDYLLEQRDLLARRKKVNPTQTVREAALYGDVGREYTIESVHGAGKPLYVLRIFDMNEAKTTERNYPSSAAATVAMYMDAAKAAGVKPKPTELHKWFTQYEAKGLHNNPRRKKANPSFNKWLDTFLEEKEIDLEEVLEVKGKQWGTNYIPVGVLVQAMKRAPKHEQEAIKTMLVKIDFRNAPVRPYLAHLGQAIARNPHPNPGLTKAGKRHLIQTMHKAGADTFTKKMRYVRRHMPHITDPAAFVGYVMQGEKR